MLAVACETSLISMKHPHLLWKIKITKFTIDPETCSICIHSTLLMEFKTYSVSFHLNVYIIPNILVMHYIETYVCMYTCMYAHIHTHTCARTHTHTHTHAHKHAHTHTHTLTVFYMM